MSWQLKDYFSLTESAISQQQFLSDKLIIKVTIPSNPKNWISAGWCKALWNETPVGSFESELFSLSINKARLIALPSLSPYRVEINLRKWIPSVNVEIYEFEE